MFLVPFTKLNMEFHKNIEKYFASLFCSALGSCIAFWQSQRRQLSEAEKIHFSSSFQSNHIFALDSPFCKRLVHGDDPGYLANLQKNVPFDWLWSLVKKLSINNNKLTLLYDLDHLRKKLSHLTLLFARSRYIQIIWLICKKNIPLCRLSLQYPDDTDHMQKRYCNERQATSCSSLWSRPFAKIFLHLTLLFARSRPHPYDSALIICKFPKKQT